jgi:putative hemolysin
MFGPGVPMTGSQPAPPRRPVNPLSIRLSAKRLPQRLVTGLRSSAEAFLGIDKFNATYAALPPVADREFSAVLLASLNIAIRHEGEPIETIPEQGPLLVIANHPFGVADGCALEALLQSRRRDCMVMATHWLGAIPEIRDRLILVDPGRGKKRRAMNVAGWRSAVRFVAEGGVLGVFPAGRVARLNPFGFRFEEEPWSDHVARLARRGRVPVLPVAFNGPIGSRLDRAARLWRGVGDALALRAFMNQCGSTIELRIGQMVQPDVLCALDDDAAATAYLRARVKALLDSSGKGKSAHGLELS